MPQLIGLALAGVAVWVGYKFVRREMARVGEELREAAADKSEPKTQPLEEGPDGVYRLKNDGEDKG